MILLPQKRTREIKWEATKVERSSRTKQELAKLLVAGLSRSFDDRYVIEVIMKHGAGSNRTYRRGGRTILKSFF